MADHCLCLLFSPIAMTKCQRRSSWREWLVWLTVRRVHIIPAGKLHQWEPEAACSYLGKSGSSRSWMMASPTPSLFTWSRPPSPQDGAVPFSMCLPNTVNAFQKHILKVSVSLRLAWKLICRPGWLWTPSPPVSASHMLYYARLSFTVTLTHGGNAVVRSGPSSTQRPCCDNVPVISPALGRHLALYSACGKQKAPPQEMPFAEAASSGGALS